MKWSADLPGVLVRRRVPIVFGWALAFAFGVPLALSVEDRLDVSARIEGSQSAAVEEALLSRFDSPFARTALVVLTGLPGPDTEGGRGALREVVSALREAPRVTRTFSYLDTGDALFLSPSGTFVIVGLDPAGASLDTVMPAVRASTGAVAARLRERFSDATLRWTGEPMLNFDVRHASTTEVRAAERRALPLTLVLLLLVFGGAAAALLPILAGALAIVLTLGVAALLTHVMPLAVTLQSVVSMLGLGLGIDYALLTVSRFREGLRAGSTTEAAAEEAARHAGGTVALSGAAVAIGFLGMLWVPVSEIRSIAIGGLLVVGTSVLVATTLLPSLLGWFGAHLEGRRWAARRATRAAGEGWRRWGAFVSAHPLLVLLAAGAPMLSLAFEARRMAIGMPPDWLPATMESTVAARELQKMGKAGLIQEIRLLLEFPEDVQALSQQGWEATRRLGDAIASDPRVAEVRSLRTFAGERAHDLSYVSLLPGFVKRAYVAGEADAALIEVIPREHVASEELSRFVRELRAKDVARLSGLAGTRLQVGGIPAFDADYEDAVAGRFRSAVAFVIGGTLLALFVGFRSVLIAIKAVALNLLSVAAAFGAVVLVFQDGHGARWLGLAAPTGAVFPALPILVFCIVFGLSMDYEVFLVARVAEARRAGTPDAVGLAEALARTGGVITSAAAVMLAVFGAFAAGDFLLIRMLGFALAVAVLLDSTVIRVALGPALLRLAGRANWWPGEGRHAPGTDAVSRG
jgi:RND superfamily putative drug exporter